MSRFVQNKLTSLVSVSASAPPIHYFKVGGDAPIEREPWRTGTSKNGLWENAAGWAPAWAMAQLQFLFFSAGCSQLMFVSIWIDRFICYDLLIGVLYGTAQEANIQTPPKIDIICERGVGWEGKHKCKIHQNSNIISRHLSSFRMNRIRQGTVFTRVHLMLCIGIATAARVVTKDERQPHGKSIEMDKVQFFIVWEKTIQSFRKSQGT